MEKEFFKFLTSIWKNLADSWQIVFLISFLILIVSISIKYAWPALSSVIDRRKGKNAKPTLDLEKHPIFSQISFWTKYKINALEFGDTRRDKIFRQILTAETISFEKNIKEVLLKRELLTMSDYHFKEYMLQNFFKILSDYNEEFERLLHVEVLDLVIHGKNGFTQWKEDSIMYTKKMVESVCDSTFYNSNTEKIWTIFNSYQSALDSTILVIEKTYYNFNGNLTKVLDKTS